MATAAGLIFGDARGQSTPHLREDREWLRRAAGTGLEAAWRVGLANRPELDAEAMIAAAAARTGLCEFGVRPHWRPALEVLVDALDREARLNALGRTIAYGQIVGILAQRLRAEALWAAHPEIAGHLLPPPIVVLGQMRSGTTRLQRLLACDPRFAHTRFFESWQPIPGRRDGAVEGRKLRAWLGLATARLLNPRFTAIHPTALNAPDEEIGFHAFSLCGAPFEAQWRVPSFARYWEQPPLERVYDEFRLLLQTVAWARGEVSERPWVLKVPQFMQDLPALLDAFPGARLLCLDRDPAAVVASSASLALNQMRIQSDAADPHWIGREWLRKVALRQQVARATRSTRPDVPQLDIRFDAMNRDWRGEMRRVYAFLDLPLSEAVERRMAAFVERAGDHARRRPPYDLATFGLLRAQVEAAMTAQPELAAAE